MKRPSIKTVILSILGTVAVAVAALSITSLASLQSTKAAAEQVGEFWIERLLTVREIKENFTNLRLVLAREGMSGGDAKSFEVAEKAFKEARTSLDNTLARFETGNDTERGKSILKNIRTALGAFDAKMENYRQLIRNGKISDASALFTAGAKPEADRVRSKISELADYIMESTRMTVASGNDRAKQAFVVTLGAAVATVLLCIGGMIFAVHGIATPIRRITAAMRNLASGDKESQVPYSGRADEVGAMAAAVEVFRQSAITNDLLEQEASRSRDATEEQRLAEQDRIEREAAELRVATQSLGESLRRLASGDLTCSIGKAFAEAYEPLREDFNAALDQLNATMAAVATAVNNMESGTREIANGATDLSRRTEQQAASLEETSGALDAITSNVAGSSKLTEVARGVAQEATSSAATSATVVAHAVEAMGRIAESSQQISNIIGVIDEIAFQTNLLALNAGVEAARAGEAGKGFAVVAQEVRELAQRSAKAAKEIKGLIQKSSAEVESGVKLVRDTGGALETIGTFITEINQHVQAIATSAQEQATGLSEVNVAVFQMDQGTQKNAALVEESTASAAALSMEAGRLRALVEQFRLDSRSRRAAPLADSSLQPAKPDVEAGQQADTVRRMLRPASHGALAVQGEWAEF